MASFFPFLILIVALLDLQISEVAGVTARDGKVTDKPAGKQRSANFIPSLVHQKSKPKHQHQPHRHPLPPAAVPGILSDASLSSHGRRKPITKLRILKKHFESGEKSLRRTKRSSAFGPKIIPELLIPTGVSMKRDLRRLRRDLGYDIPTVQDLAQPSEVMTKTTEYQPSYPYQRDILTMEEPELERILKGFNFLEQLALLTQSRRVPPVVSLEQRHPTHSSASRFAPQPKLFMDVNKEPDVHDRALRTEPRFPYDASMPQDVVWVPAERLSKRRSWGGLSRVPGFKRSSPVFRKATREHQKGFNLGSKLRQSDISSLASILGAEGNPIENRIRRAAM